MMSKARVTESVLTSGLDVGARSVKIAILSHEGARSVVLAKALVRVQGRGDDLADRVAIRDSWGRVLANAGLSPADVDYVASTGTRDRETFRVGRFYRSTHAVGARLLFPDATAALDIGTDQIRCALLREPANGCRYAATPRRPGGGGEVFEANACRTGVDLDDASALTASTSTTRRSELVTASLTLLRVLAVHGKIVLTGGMALEADFVRTLWSRLLESESNASLLISPEAIFAGAYGAAILAARRYFRVARARARPAADPLSQRLLGIDRERFN